MTKLKRCDGTAVVQCASVGLNSRHTPWAQEGEEKLNQKISANTPLLQAYDHGGGVGLRKRGTAAQEADKAAPADDSEDEESEPEVCAGVVESGVPCSPHRHHLACRTSSRRKRMQRRKKRLLRKTRQTSLHN